jgi:hypothetical protein
MMSGKFLYEINLTDFQLLSHYLPGGFVENRGNHSQSPNRDSNLGRPEYELAILIIQMERL